MPRVSEVFNAHADDYDAARRRLIPPFETFYGTAVEAVGLASPVRRILDLGAGTGLLSARVHAVFPEAELTLLDGAERMLKQARERLGEERVRYERGDFARALPPGPWDAIISALAIHHLSHEEKRVLFVRVYAELRPGGVFVNAEQVDGATPRFTAHYARWHEERARAAGTDDAEWVATLERMGHDRCASVEDQLTWMRAAGFVEADCLFKDHRFAVLVARR